MSKKQSQPNQRPEKMHKKKGGLLPQFKHQPDKLIDASVDWVPAGAKVADVLGAAVYALGNRCLSAVGYGDRADFIGGEELIGHYARPPFVGCEKNSPSIKNSPATSLTLAVNFELMRTFTKNLSAPVETTSIGMFFNVGKRFDISLTRRPVFAFNVFSICDFLSIFLFLFNFQRRSSSPMNLVIV